MVLVSFSGDTRKIIPELSPNTPLYTTRWFLSNTLVWNNGPVNQSGRVHFIYHGENEKKKLPETSYSWTILYSTYQLLISQLNYKWGKEALWQMWTRAHISQQAFRWITAFASEFIFLQVNLTPVLLSQDIPWLCKQCRPRSFEANWSRSALFAIHMWIYINNPDQVIWLAENLKRVWHLNLFSRIRVKR